MVRPPPVADASPVTPAASLTAVSCGWGGVGPTAIPPRAPNAWVVVLLDLHAHRALSSVHVASLEMLDARGVTVARGVAPFDVRVAPVDRVRGDFSSEGTTELPAVVPGDARLRLRVHAPLDTLLQHIAAPATFRVVLRIDGVAATLQMSGPIDGEWPTA